MSDNDHTSQNLLEVEGILDLNENKTGVLLDPPVEEEKQHL